jgi:lysophospholipase L1-like esterase
MWATSIPLHTRADAKIFSSNIERIKERNKIALDYVTAKKDIRVDDLWALVVDHPEYYQGGDGAHPLAPGYTALAQKVAEELTILLNEK